MNRKGTGLPINTLVKIILALIVLVVLVLIFSGAAREFFSSIFAKLKGASDVLNATKP